MNLSLLALFVLMFGASLIAYVLGKATNQSHVIDYKKKLKKMNDSLSSLQEDRLKGITDNRDMFLKLSEQDRILHEIMNEKVVLNQKIVVLENEKRIILKELKSVSRSGV